MSKKNKNAGAAQDGQAGAPSEEQQEQQPQEQSEGTSAPEQSPAQAEPEPEPEPEPRRFETIDTSSGAEPVKGSKRLRCTLRTVVPGVINGIRFVEGPDGGLVSEALREEHEEQVERLLRARAPQDTEGYERVTVTEAQARLIDQACLRAAAAERATPGAVAPEVEQSLDDQRRINLAISRERDAAVERVKVLEQKIAESPVDELKAEIKKKSETIASLRDDVARLEGKVAELTRSVEEKTGENAQLRNANDALTKQVDDLTKPQS